MLKKELFFFKSIPSAIHRKMKENIKETDRETEGTLKKQRERADPIASNSNQPDMACPDSGM